MLFGKNDKKANERILYKTKPNLVLGCKKAIYGVVLLGVILFVSPMIIQFVGEMQVYLISHIKLSLTRYAAIAFFAVILIDIVYIIWQLVGWYSIEYTLTDTRIIIKSGVISTKKNYMPYTTIQDINTSQSIFARLFNVGTVSAFSAYDNNQIELQNISNPSEVEEIIFSRMVGPRNFQAPPQRFPQQQPSFDTFEDYTDRNDYYDEYETITPITHERNYQPRRDYEYYPEDLAMQDSAPKHNYEYEPYDNGFNNHPRTHSQNLRYNEVRDDYSNGDRNYYQDNGQNNYYDEYVGEASQNQQTNIDDSSENVIQRHFDKFRK